jgi:hypothetical protein
MGYIEDTRKLMQDFLAPELRAIAVRLDAVEALIGANERHAEERFKDAEARTQQRFSDISQLAQDAEARTQQRFSDISQLAQDAEARTQQRFSEVERRAEQRHSETLNAIASLSNYQAVLERLARLESKQNVSAA